MKANAPSPEKGGTCQDKDPSDLGGLRSHRAEVGAQGQTESCSRTRHSSRQSRAGKIRVQHLFLFFPTPETLNCTEVFKNNVLQTKGRKAGHHILHRG